MVGVAKVQIVKKNPLFCLVSERMVKVKGQGNKCNILDFFNPLSKVKVASVKVKVAMGLSFEFLQWD